MHWPLEHMSPRVQLLPSSHATPSRFDHVLVLLLGLHHWKKRNTTEIFMCGYRYCWILIDQRCNTPWWQFFTPVLVCCLRSETRRRAKQIWPDTNWIFRWRLRQSSKSVYALGAVFARCKPACQRWSIYHVSSSILNILWADNQKLFVKNRTLLVILLPDRDFLACSDS